MNTWYFTFCLGDRFKHRFIRINGTYSEARDKMFEMFDDKWAFQYSEKDFLPQIKKYGLEELTIFELDKM